MRFFFPLAGRVTRQYRENCHTGLIMRLLPPMKTWLFILLQRILPQHFLSRLVGKLASWHAPRWFLQPLLAGFVKKYQVEMQLAAHPDLNHYHSFNQFFIRQLKENARPIGDGVVSPADGTVSEIGVIAEQQLLQAKGKHYSLQQLLAGDSNLSHHFTNGNFATIYLSPRDYHRVHMPVAGQLIESIYVPGTLFSVNPTTVNHIDGVFARNERLINLFQTEHGPMAVILVGAMLVAGMHTVWQGKITPNNFHQIQHWQYQAQDIHLAKGAELGYFNFGSTAIVLFGKDKIKWCNNLQTGSTVKMGENIGE